jgi:hypothetical protein
MEPSPENGVDPRSNAWQRRISLVFLGSGVHNLDSPDRAPFHPGDAL